MKILYQSPELDFKKKKLCLTHTDRPVDFERCSREFLVKRYRDPLRLPPQEDFYGLKSILGLSPYAGEITIWSFEENDLRKRCELMAHLRPENYRPQHVLWYQGKLWVLGVEILEIYDDTFSLIHTVRDPWLSGAHTLSHDEKGRVYLSCAASDSILIVDARTFQVVQALRMPEKIYGSNYPLSRSDSVVDHFISNDAQLTHVNSAWPWRGGVLVSTLIQGALGWFDSRGEYQELLRGFVGCHGARVDSRSGDIYFSDSCSGKLFFLDAAFQAVEAMDFESRWLHDACQLEGDVFAAAVSDKNQVVIADLRSKEILNRIDGSPFGAGTQFIGYAPC